MGLWQLLYMLYMLIFVGLKVMPVAEGLSS